MLIVDVNSAIRGQGTSENFLLHEFWFYKWTEILKLIFKFFQLALSKVNPLIHFGLCDGTRSSPTVRFFSSLGTETELRSAARDFFRSVGMDVDLNKRTVHLTRIIKW